MQKEIHMGLFFFQFLLVYDHYPINSRAEEIHTAAIGPGKAGGQVAPCLIRAISCL